MFSEEIEPNLKLLKLSQEVTFKAGQHAERAIILELIYDLMPDSSANQCDVLIKAVDLIKARND
jgi:hypothetical protein